MDLRIDKVVDGAGARAWHAIADVCVPFDHPGLLADPIQEVLAYLPDVSRSQKQDFWTKDFWVARAGEATVAAGSVELSLVDNLHLAGIEIDVPPKLRRRGYGREMFEFLRMQCRSAGRSTLVGHVGAPLGGTSPGESFATAVGARMVLEEVRSELRTAMIDRSALKELEKRSQAGAAGHEVVQWIDRAPDDVVEQLAQLRASFLTEAPMGGLSLEPERWDIARLRGWEQETVDRGRLRVATGAASRALWVPRRLHRDHGATVPAAGRLPVGHACRARPSRARAGTGDEDREPLAVGARDCGHRDGPDMERGRELAHGGDQCGDGFPRGREVRGVADGDLSAGGRLLWGLVYRR